jgi:hypothetical protein
MQVTREEAVLLLLRLLVVQFFLKRDLPLKELLEASRK